MSLTPCTHYEAARAFWQSHQDVIGGPCETLLLETLLIQWDFETAGGTAMHAWNMGNLRGKGDAGTQSINGANEIIDGKVIVVSSGFAAYTSARAGAAAMIRFLGTASNPPAPNRFAAAWEAAKIGDLNEYARQIGKDVQGPHAYMTDDPGHYARGLLARRPVCRAAVGKFLADLTPINAPEDLPPPPLPKV